MLQSSGWSLRLKLLLSVGLVLLLPALISIVQGVYSAQRDLGDLRERLTSSTRGAASPAENVLASAREVALALASLPAIRNATAGCNEDLASAMQGIPFLNNIARIDASGRVLCAGLSKSVGMNGVHSLPVWRDMPDQYEFVVTGMRQSSLTHRRIVLGMLPLHDSVGRFQGTLNVAIDVRWLNEALLSSPLPPGSVMAIFDRERNLISATDSATARAIFLDRAFRGRPETVVGTGKDANGMAWTYAIAPLLGPNVFVGFALPDTKLYGAAYESAAVDIALPFVMILLTWIAIWIVNDRQLTRWIIYLRKISAAYRAGHYAIRPALKGAPSELQLLGEAMAEMAAAIHERDRSLREAVTQKTLLIKEIHHRVKNNLQVVMSLLSLQAKRLKDPAARDALKETQTRINALALVHRVLYEIDDQTSVNMSRLLELLAENTNEGFGGDRRDVHVLVNAVERNLPSETAVPLSLFTVEALTNAFKHAFPSGRGGTIRVVFEGAGGGKLRLAVEDDGIGFARPDTHANIGERLIRTFGQQIGGTSSIHSNSPSGTTVEIVFSDPASGGAQAIS